jgi:hypothetical protein
MPWTFAHPAAVLPLKRYCPSQLNFAALVIGSLTPDLGYYIGLWRFASYAHTLSGSLFICIPTGWALLVSFYLLRKPTWYLLPEPHRSLLRPLAATPPPSRAGSILAASISIILGVWSHIIWDAFTHRNRWAVTRYSFLQDRIFAIAGTDFPVYTVLQHLSTFVGVAALVAVYYRWLRRRGSRSLLLFEREDLWRYAILTTLALVSLLIAILLGARSAEMADGSAALTVFLTSVALYSAKLFIPMLLAAGLFFHLRRGDV